MAAPPAGAGRNGHIASLRLLNKERWEAQLKEQQSTGNHLFNRPNPFDQGARDSNGAGFVQPYVRTKHPDRDGHRLSKMRGTVNWVNEDGKYVSEKKYATFKDPAQGGNPKGGLRVDPSNRLKYVPVYEDSMSIPIDASEKYRIPYTSVVNKVGDCKLFFCCGWRLTAVRAATRTTGVPIAAERVAHGFRRNGSGGSTSSASPRTSRWSSSPSTLPTGSTG